MKQLETYYLVDSASGGVDKVEAVAAEARSMPATEGFDVMRDELDPARWVSRTELLKRPGGPALLQAWMGGDESAFRRVRGLLQYAAELDTALMARSQDYDAVVADEIAKGVPADRIEWAIGQT